MTWSEFKASLEKEGVVKDDDVILYIDFHGGEEIVVDRRDPTGSAIEVWSR